RGSRLLRARFVSSRSAGLARAAPFFPGLVRYRCRLPEHRVPVTLANQRKGGALRMTDLRLDGPVTILVLLGLTLPEVSEGDLEKIRAAAAPGSTIRVAPQVRDAIALAGEVEIILGFIPESLFHAPPRLRWVHAIPPDVDIFLYPAIRA